MPEKVFQPYTYLSYDEIRQKLAQVAESHGRFVQLTTVENEYGIKHRVNCGSERCQIDLVRLTDSQSTSKKVQVYISGALHGNERVGPHAAYYFIEYMAMNAEGDYEIGNLLKHVEFIITPTTNADGYYKDVREEELSREARDSYGHWHVDPNRDFPYN